MAAWPTDLYEGRMVERFRQGDPEALSALFDMHVDRVYAYARHIVGNREDAEEIASESFMRAFRKAVDYRGEGPFRGWLFGITRNLCRDRLKQPRLLTVSDIIGDLESEPESSPLHEDVRMAMRDLPEEYRDVLILCEVEQWDAREAADILEKSVAATKSLLYRARRALRDKLTERWKES